MGSCFSDHMAAQMNKVRLPVLSNPFGTVYNPWSILNQLKFLTGTAPLDERRIVLREGKYFHLDFHSSFFGADRASFSERINAQKFKSMEAFTNCSHIFITLGTSWVYQWRDDQQIVSNCHKLPARDFIKKLMPIELILSCLEEIIALTSRLNENAKVVFTVSPVRHIKDGLVENNRSKARLLEALHLLCEEGKATYFPAYEWVIDDLRDYRYYDEDMIHPSAVAVKYIWQKFCGAFCTEATIELMKYAEKIFALQQHRPFDTTGPDYEKHLTKISGMETEWHQKLNQLL